MGANEPFQYHTHSLRFHYSITPVDIGYHSTKSINYFIWHLFLKLDTKKAALKIYAALLKNIFIRSSTCYQPLWQAPVNPASITRPRLYFSTPEAAVSRIFRIWLHIAAPHNKLLHFFHILQVLLRQRTYPLFRNLFFHIVR